ncbi:kinesin-like protein KIN-7C [Ricinus communis]|uniref:kinesin-like protein KIN-7C n=1 Tax=Ricinus communis TaxID=3988 RepID=UPI00201B2ECD|nr:kinesin-like protein KIN-7C [Ricinus communis]XP_015575181.2 kinesin-like protein KIN-7C [Ricinus communis]
MSIRGREETMSMGSGDEIIIDSEQEEKIFVSVRMRPLNEREVARNDICDWECINNNTIIFKSNMPDRSMVPTAYTFDRVFGSECSTKQVYEEGAKEIALAAVSGINSSIFAYGQTSSGKTYTMDGVTEYAVADIYEYMNKHKEREFVLKFSAMEIYNEAVRDLLSSDSTPLRVLDDPEKGTVVERLIEETLIDWNHLQELLIICEAQRQIGETSMNENSSRSHQVIRLTIESSAREYSGVGNSSILISTVHFVDLAGSERASQTLAGGARLKEGSHINRSLLTLGTVIRKLSKGKNGHIPYRDSKLTRILQNSLGGNARTAMICTISPSRSHVEQSRNTLLFASCANEVATNAQVNVVMSDKALVKQLRKELAKLESRLKSMESISVTGDTAALLREKELLIEKMDKEIKELTWQRDLAQSRVDSLLREVGDNRLSRVGENSASESSEGITPLGLDAGFARTNTVKDFDDPSVLTPTRQIQQIPDPEDGFLLNNSTPKFSEPDPFRFWESTSQENNEDICKEVRCIETDEASVISKAEDGVLLSSSDRQEKEVATAEETDEGALPSMAMQEEDKESSHNDSYNSYHALKQKIQDLHETISLLQQFPPNEAGASSSKALTWSRSKSRRSVVMTIPSALWYEKEEENENILPASFEEDNLERRGGTEQKLAELEPDDKTGKISGKYSRNSTSSACIEEETIKEINIDVDDTTTVLDFVAGVNTIAKPQSEEQIGDVLVPEASTRTADLWRDAGRGNSARQNRANSILKFERYRRKIIELWARCNVPLVHRSYFFLIFKGDPSDNVYLEVELRRLYFLKDTSARGTNTLIDTQIVSLNSSLKSLNREREHLARQLQKKFTKRERVELYVRWGIDLDTKQRSLQLIRRLWTDTKDLKHMRESSVLVAKLIGFVEPRYAPKEMFGLSFLTPLSTQKSSSWRDNMSSLSLL